MHAVFFMCERIRIDGLKDQTIHLFEDEQTADEFVFEKMVEAGLISAYDERFVVGEVSFDNKEAAMSAARFCFESMDFFHVYEVIDHRKAATESARIPNSSL